MLVKGAAKPALDSFGTRKTFGRTRKAGLDLRNHARAHGRRVGS